MIKLKTTALYQETHNVYEIRSEFSST